MNQPKDTNRSIAKPERQPYRMRLPRFILDEDIGLGDAIKRITYSAGISPTKDCGCDRRASTLNRWITFSPRQSR